jgi:hypothetical protein
VAEVAPVRAFLCFALLNRFLLVSHHQTDVMSFSQCFKLILFGFSPDCRVGQSHPEMFLVKSFSAPGKCLPRDLVGNCPTVQSGIFLINFVGVRVGVTAGF